MQLPLSTISGHNNTAVWHLSHQDFGRMLGYNASMPQRGCQVRVLLTTRLRGASLAVPNQESGDITSNDEAANCLPLPV